MTHLRVEVKYEGLGESNPAVRSFGFVGGALMPFFDETTRNERGKSVDGCGVCGDSSEYLCSDCMRCPECCDCNDEHWDAKHDVEEEMPLY